MRFLKTVILVLIGLVILSGIGYFGYQFYQRLHAPAESPFKAIPQNSALIIKLNKPDRLWNESKQANSLWQDLFSIPALSNLKGQVSFMDSALRKDQKLAATLRNNPLFLVVTPVVGNTYGLLYLINVESRDADELIEDFINRTWSASVTVQKNSYAGSAMFRIMLKKSTTSFHFATRNGIFICSSNELLVKQAIDRLSLNFPSEDDPSFLKVIASSGKNVDANLFINYEKIAPFVAGLTTRGKLADFLNVSNFASWSGLDIIQKKDNWLISGYTVTNPNEIEYLSLFSGQSPQKISMCSAIRGDASSVTWIGLSKPDIYRQKLILSKTATSIYCSGYPNLMTIENDNQIELDRYFLPWTGNEIGFARIQNPEPALPGDVYGLFRIGDRTLADSLLQNLARMVSGKILSQVYKGHTIINLNIPYIIPGIWGNLFQPLTGSMITFLDDWLIAGNDVASLQRYIDQVMSGNTLDKEPTFQNFSSNLSDQSNLCYYYNIRRGFGEIRSMVVESIGKEITPAADTLKKFESFGVQIITNNDNFITNVFIPHNGSDPARGPLAWRAALDTAVAGRPQIFRNALKGKPAILAADLSNTLYLIDGTGTIQWKLKLPGKPMGDICEIHPKTGDSTYFLFNTQKQICVVDENGLFVYGSPFPLPLRAVTSLSCIEFPGARNYHVFIPLEDKKIYDFDVRGKQQPGWEKPSSGDAASKPVQVLNFRKRDFLFITSGSGKTKITDIHGRDAIKLKGSVTFSPRSAFYLNKTNSKGDFITSTADGRLVYLRSDGKTSDVKFNKFTPEHIFYYTDINNDKVQEFIFYDLSKLYCYNRFQKILYDYTFPSPVFPPVMVTSPSGDMLVGTVAPKTGDLFLFGAKGPVSIDPAIRGNTPFDLGIIDPAQGTCLVTGSGKEIKAYILPKL